nr:acyl-CoA reductase [Pullulanibacillus pueri]
MAFTQFSEAIIEGERTVYHLKYPSLTSDDIQQMMNVVEANRESYLASLTTQEIVEKIDQAIQKWLDPDYPLRRRAEQLLPVITGYDKDMVRLELKKYMRTFRKKELLRFLDEEFDQPAMLDEFRPRKSGGMSRAFGPNTLFHVFSGNVPGVQIWSLIMGLLLKSATLGKTSLSEPLLPVLFAQSLEEVDEKLAETLAILPWKGGTAELENAAIANADAVIVYGSNKTVETMRQRVPLDKPFLTYGHKISFAVIGKEALTPDLYYETIYKLAEDISIYDQQSCLAPQSVFVEQGGAISPKQFAQILASELGRYHKKRPRARLTDEEAMAIQKLRDRYQFEALQGDQVEVYASQTNTAWTVVYHEEAGFEGSPLNRSIHIFSSENLERDVLSIKPYQSLLQSCGLAVAPDRLFTLADRLGHYGVNRICSVGEMNSAKPGWHHDGGFNLLDLVRIVDIERDVEQKMEAFDPDVE